MFRYFNKIFNKILKIPRKALSRKEGQVAVILILVTAAALIFYAASLNLTRVSQVKALTTIAADTGASLLGSYMVSYAERLSQSSLGGVAKVCGYTGLISSIISVIVAIIAIVLTVATYGSAFMIALSVISVALAVVAVVLQLASIQPGLSSMWNDYIFDLMELKNAFTEEGVQTGLTASITDQVTVPDVGDFDQDRIFGFDSNGDPLDKISRFGFYYQKKRLDLIPVPISSEIDSFLDALRNFSLNDGDGWGLFDDTGPACDSAGASECDSCCLPLGTRDSSSCGDTPVYDVDGNLTGYTENPGVLTACAAGSPYGSSYPWVYDKYHGNATNTFVSFQEQLGRDDEHQLFEKSPAAPNGAQTSVLSPPPPLPPINFQLKDTTGFYTPTVYSSMDNRTGVYPFFYKIADWKVNLDLVAEPFDLTAKPAQCHWCDQRETSVGGCPANQPLEIPQLILPLNPATLSYNTTYCVDGTNLVSGNPPLAVDRARLPDASTGLIEAAPAQCAQNAVGDYSIGFWKRGGDRFCSADGSDSSWPYYGQCRKYVYDANGLASACGQSGGDNAAENWPDDLVDDLVYGINDFADWASEILGYGAESLASTLDTWYPEASQWIERGTNSGATNDSACTSCCYTCSAQDGTLWIWYDKIREMKTRLEAWRDTSLAGAACTDVWCVPPAGCSPGAPSAEAATFDSNGDGIRGDIEDITACVNWNANDSVTTTSSSPVTATGNYEKFRECDNACTDVINNINLAQRAVDANDLCSALPRSLVPGFDTTAYVSTELAALLACQTSLTAANCTATPSLTCVAYGVTYTCSTIPSITTEINSRIAAGSCGNASFMASLRASIPEAQNQAAKFSKRYDFLSGRLAELDNLISVLGDAESEFYGFLTCADADLDGQPDGAACRLIKGRINATDDTGLPYHAIYGWQSEPEKGQPQGSGKWHIVRADARIPKRCDNSCDANQTSSGGDPEWPWVKTSSNGWERCYFLTSMTGTVKARVSRYDETGTFAALSFPNAVEIWKSWLTRTDRIELASPDDIEAECTSLMAAGCATSSSCQAALGTYYYGAFLLNQRLNNVADPECLTQCERAQDVSACKSACPLVDNTGCWDLANKLLTQGVTSEACAQYYSKTGSTLDFKFVDCANF